VALAEQHERELGVELVVVLEREARGEGLEVVQLRLPSERA
jgi:hypothetical protein